MMDKINASEGKKIAFAIAKAVCDAGAYLSEIDGLIGDGDHGINMKKGFGMFMESYADGAPGMSPALMALGRTLLDDIGGSMGPLYGTFFMKMARVCRGAEEIDAAMFADMLQAALNGVKDLGAAKVGDKTMVDCLEPAAAAFRKTLDEGGDLGACLETMTAAAERGRDSTKDLVAKLGRSSRLGERSCGVLDAGAASCAIILKAMAQTITSV